MAEKLPPGFQIITPQSSGQVDLPEGFEILSGQNGPRRTAAEDAKIGLLRGGQRLPGLILGIPGDIGRLGVAAENLVGQGVSKLTGGQPLQKPKGMIPGPLETLSMIPGSEDIIGGIYSRFGEVPKPESTLGRATQLGVEFLPMAVGPRGKAQAAEVLTSIPKKVYEKIKGGASRAKAVAIPAAAVAGTEAATQGTALEEYAPIAALVAGGALASPGRVRSVASKTNIPTSNLQVATDEAFRKLRQAGINYNSNAIDDLVKSLETKFGRGSTGMAISPTRQRMAFSLLQDMKKLRGGNVDWNDLKNIRSEASDIANSFEPQLAAERKFAREIIKSIDEFHNLPPSKIISSSGNIPPERVGDLTKSALALNQRLGKTKTIENLLATANANADPARTLRSNFQRLATRIAAGKSKGWTKDEVDAIQSIAKGNYESGALNTISKMGVDASMFGMLRGAFYGAIAAPPLMQGEGMLVPALTAAVMAPATAVRAFGPLAIQNRSQQVRNLVAGGPAAQAQANRVAMANQFRQLYGAQQIPGLLDEDRR